VAEAPHRDGARPLPARLPAGRHGLPREAVREHQRQRLLTATALAVREGGCASLTIGDITKRAGVSRVTFYQLFEGKSEALLAAFEQSFAALRARIAAACPGPSRWPQNVIAALGTALEFAASSPAQAALLGLAAAGVEPALAERARAANRELAEMLRSARPESAAGAGRVPLPALAEEALIGGLATVIGSRLAAGQEEELAALAPHLSELILASYLGAAPAASLLAEIGAASPSPGENQRVS
jgi:AcrR family transcriptional regulator